MQRYSSRSSNAASISSEDTLVSPLSIPGTRSDYIAGASPLILAGPDNKKWVDLDLIPPKLLQELRSQRVLSSTNHPTKTLVKGPSKLKAWARNGKREIDLKLGRKFESTPNEVSDSMPCAGTMVSDDPKAEPVLNEGPLTCTLELPGASNTVHELPGTSTPQELDCSGGADRRSLSSILSMSTNETLPRYEVKSVPSVASTQPVVTPGASTALTLQIPAKPSSSPSSIVGTPTGGISSLGVNPQPVEASSPDDQFSTTCHTKSKNLAETEQSLGMQASAAEIVRVACTSKEQS